MELKHYFDLLMRWLAMVILGAASAFARSSLQAPVYQATPTLLISPAPVRACEKIAPCCPLLKWTECA